LASLVASKTKPHPTTGKVTEFWRLFFTFGVDVHGQPKRNVLRLGRGKGTITSKQTEKIKSSVEALVSAKLSGEAIDTGTAAWLGDIRKNNRPPYKKLAKLKLADPARDDVPAVAPASIVPTVAEYIGGFIKLREGQQKFRTTNGSRQDADSLLAFLATRGKVTLDSVTAGDARDFVIWLRSAGSSTRPGKGFAEATIGRRIRRCSQFFLAAVDDGHISKNPFARVKAPSQENKARFRFVTRAETAKRLKVCPELRMAVDHRPGSLRRAADAKRDVGPDVGRRGF
jgi:hypothetical protein